MASLIVRNLDEKIKTQLRMRAADRGRSMEEEVRQILKDALEHDPPRNLADLALELFGPKHSVRLEPHPPVTPREAPDFSAKEFDPD